MPHHSCLIPTKFTKILMLDKCTPKIEPQYASDIHISVYHLIFELVTVMKQQVKDSQRREKGNHTKCHTVLVSSKSRDHDLPPYFKL